MVILTQIRCVVQALCDAYVQCHEFHYRLRCVPTSSLSKKGVG